MENLLQSAKLCYRGGDISGAETHCLQLLQQQPGNAQARHLLGVLALQRGNFDRAVEHISSALKITSRQAEWHCDLGNAYLQQGDLRLATAAYRAALEIEPNHLLSRHNLGEALFRSGDLTGAVHCFEGVVATDPGYHPAHYNLGNVYKAQCRFKAASDAYRRALEINPKLLQAHYNLGNTLREEGFPEAAVRSYQAVLKLNPEYLPALINLGCVLSELGRVGEAVGYLEQASVLDPASEHIRFNLDQAYGRIIPAWHFPMLADRARNAAYQRAIERAVDSKTHVLDIGAGSGLLAMMAARAGAARVTACEMVPFIAKAAREIIDLNGYADRVSLLEMKSTQIEVGGEMPGRADLIVSEIVDVGLLGEGVIPTLRHALQCLAAPGVRLIPRGATVYGQLLTLPRLRPAHPLGEISDFDLSPFSRFRSPAIYQQIDLNAEPHRAISEVFPVKAFDFYHPPPVTSDSRPEVTSLDVVAVEAGTVQAVAFWFDLHLDEETKLSTAADGDAFCWGQAVQFFAEDRSVSVGEVIKLDVAVSDARIRFGLR